MRMIERKDSGTKAHLLVTALAFRAAGWTIRYKLVLEQLWGG